MTKKWYGARALIVSLASAAVIAAGGEGVARGQGTPALHGKPVEHAPAPQIVTYGGPVLSTPLVVPILFSSDPLAGPLTDYFTKLGATDYLAAGLGEYGVTSVTVAAPVIIADAPPDTFGDLDMSIWLGGMIDDGTLPAADGNTMFHVILPSTTAVQTGQFFGYPLPTCMPGNAEAYSSAGGTAAFSYVPRCAGSTSGLSELDYVTSHGTGGLVDAIVDPYLFEDPGYYDTSWYGSGWALLAQNLGYDTASLGQMCPLTLHQATARPADIGYLVPRIWSNQAAAAGHDPCPDPTAPQSAYFNAAPDIAGGTALGLSNFVKGVQLGPGQRVTIPVRFFSDGPTSEWTVSAVERPDLAPDPYGVLSFSFNNARGKNGDVRYLTIERAATSDGSIQRNLVFSIVSTNGAATHEWLVVVGDG